jgi:hypothetical protein
MFDTSNTVNTVNNNTLSNTSNSIEHTPTIVYKKKAQEIVIMNDPNDNDSLSTLHSTKEVYTVLYML